jgi:hypothetical protein
MLVTKKLLLSAYYSIISEKFADWYTKEIYSVSDVGKSRRLANIGKSSQAA